MDKNSDSNSILSTPIADFLINSEDSVNLSDCEDNLEFENKFQIPLKLKKTNSSNKSGENNLHWSNILPSNDHRSKFIHDACAVFLAGKLFNELSQMTKDFFIENLKKVLKSMNKNWQEVKKMRRDSITASFIMLVCQKSSIKLKVLVDTFKDLENYDLIFSKISCIRKSKAYISLESWMA